MTLPRDQPTTCLAPSPTGELHLGNARTFLVNWALARQRGWRVVLRIDDLDGPRVKPGAAEQALADLRWLGLDWDDGPLYQRADLAPYREALEWLWAQGRIYPCICSRREIAAAQSAPHAEDREMRYPGTCRPAARIGVRPSAAAEAHVESPTAVASVPGGGEVAWRLRVPDEPIRFVDEIHGPQEVDVQRQVGDFIVATKAGLPSYQLATVVDDARQGVSDVVRGDDLIGSTGRQLWLYRALGLRPLPRYGHLPLVNGPDGQRMAKRHGGALLGTYRDQQVPPERVIGLLARWCGTITQRRAMSAAEFGEQFDLARLPREAITMTAEDQAWLMGT